MRSLARRAANQAIGLLPEPRRSVLREGLDRIYPGKYPVESEAPPCPPGRVTGLPDFVGVGAQKAGTSWWLRLLTSQAGVHNEPGFRKERHFFDRFFDASLSDDDLEEYRRWFPRPPGTLAGEWTPCYMFHFWVPPLMSSALPDAKLLVLLRDPVERYVSGLTHDRGEREVVGYSRADEAFARGLYGAQLERLRAWVPADRILVQQFERCRVDVRGELRRTLSFLGVDTERPVLGDLADRGVNRTDLPKVEVPAHVREELAARYQGDADRLLRMYPDLDMDLWPGLSGPP